MNTEKLKVLYENLPKGIKYLFAPIFVRLMVQHPEFRRTWKELDAFSDYSPEKQKQIQMEKLRETLCYAADHVPYYRQIFAEVGFDPRRFTDLEELKKLPLMDKEIAVAQGERLYSDEDIPCYEAHTSGSTGKVFRMLLDKASIYRERAFVTHYQHQFGYDPMKTRTVSFWGHNKDADYYYSPLKNEIVISPFRLFREEEFEAIWQDVTDFRPEVISGYPAAISVFADLVRKHHKELPLKFVEFFAENYTPELRRRVEDTFRCPTIARYGHTERSAFAELYGDAYRFNALYGYTELLPFETEAGETLYRIVCTGFLSRKMPLIRYATDDVVRYTPDGRMEICGHTTSEAKVIAANGARIYKGTLAPHIAPFEKVRLYQFVQRQPGKVYLDLVPDEPLTQEDYQLLQSYYKRKCEGLLEVTIRIVEEPALNARGKYCWVINEADRE